MSFLRHAGIYRSDVAWHNLESWGRGTASRWSAPGPAKRRDGTAAPCSSSAMSFRAGYSSAGCSPAEPASASPTGPSMHWGIAAGNYWSANGNLSLISVSQRRGAVQAVPSPVGRLEARDRWRNGWDAAGVPCRDDGKVRRLGRGGGAVRLAPSVM